MPASTPAKAACSSRTRLTPKTSGPSIRIAPDRKSTRLNSSHLGISYAVFCLTDPARTTFYTLSLHDALPIYLMGVGRPEQIADYVALGIDMMDCVLPTRAARHACLYTSEGRVLIKNSRYAEDQRPIDSNCSCSVCRRYSRAYLRHLFAAGEMTAAILATYHNVHFYLDIMRRIREAIGFGNLAKFSSEMHARYTVDQLENL